MDVVVVGRETVCTVAAPGVAPGRVKFDVVAAARLVGAVPELQPRA